MSAEAVLHERHFSCGVVEEVNAPGVLALVVAENVDGAVVLSHAEVAVILTRPAIHDLRDLAHVAWATEAQRHSAPALPTTLDEEARHRDASTSHVPEAPKGRVGCPLAMASPREAIQVARSTARTPRVSHKNASQG